MKRFTLSVSFLIMTLIAFSQKIYFVYFQSEAAQPFFVKMSNKVYSSTAAGYLILSKLKDSIYNFNIGFSKNVMPEQSFSIGINKKDHGYLLKDFGEKGWGLYDLQTSAVQMPVQMIESSNNGKQNVSSFTDILSKAANDPSLKEKQVLPKVEEKKPETVPQDVVKRDEVKPTNSEREAIKKEDVKTEIKQDSIFGNQEVQKDEIKTQPAEAYRPTTVIRKSESISSEGLGLIYIDDYGNGTRDTIRLLIPGPKEFVKDTNTNIREEKKFLDIMPDTSGKIKEVVPEVKKDTVSATTLIANNEGRVTKNNCLGIASENDFFKLRKKMAAETTDESMIAEAKKFFKIKCFTTIQIKNLSTLILDDAGKYQFFDAAYNYVSDLANFASLQSEIRDSYYLNRFKAILR